MGQTKLRQLEQIQFENVTFQIEGLDPVLKSVDLDLPMDQTVLVQASDPSHAVYVLEILAGRVSPQTGKIKWIDDANSENSLTAMPFYEVVSGYFESQRPSPDVKVAELFKQTGAAPDVIQAANDHFDLEAVMPSAFRELNYEMQKLMMLIVSTLRTPQMLVLEDPALGLSEDKFLDYLDWIQYWQRQGFLRHVFLTNNHPTAARHLDTITMFVDEGLIYIEDDPLYKKIVHF